MADEIQEEEIKQGPGAMLKERRESLQLSIEDIANKLHLRPAVVAELEDDIIDHAVSMTFTKGYFRLYAKHLEIDPAPVLEAFDKLANPIKQPAKLQSFSKKMAKQASDTRLMMFSYFILFAVIAMAVIWWFQLPGDGKETTNINNNTEFSSEIVTSESELASSHRVGSENSDFNASSDSTVASGTGQPGQSATSDMVSSTSQTSTFQSSDVYNAESANVQIIDEQSNSSQLEQNSSQNDLQDQVDVVIETVQQTENSFTNEDNALTALQSTANTANSSEQTIPEAVDSEAVLLGENASQDNSSGEINPGENSLKNGNPQSGNFQVQSAAEVELSFSSDGAAQSQFADANVVNPITREVIFTFIEDCWMNLTDATGENIAYGVKNAGRVMPVTGIPPFEVVLGAPQGVQISVDGVPFDMSQFPAGRTARFTIGE